MRSFVCDVCGAQIAFENVTCLTCGSPLAFSSSVRRVVVVTRSFATGFEYRPVENQARGGEAFGDEPGRNATTGGWTGRNATTGGWAGDGGAIEFTCANYRVAECNWLAPSGAVDGLCLSCRLTRTRPGDGDPAGLAAFVRAEAAKRRLVYQLLDLGLPVVPWMDDPINGLAVDLLSSRDQPVVTGHANGVITLDLAEGDDTYREQVRVQMGEPYRTLLGHLRHESGHFYWQRLTGGQGKAGTFRDVFGDERADYRQSVNYHYQEGFSAGWEASYVSLYASMHPWEDWAETFAHYLHLRDLLQTADAYGLTIRPNPGHMDLGQAGPSQARPYQDDPGYFDPGQADPGQPDPGHLNFGQAGLGQTGSGDRGNLGPDDVQLLVDRWLPLSYALNAVNRSIGKSDLYPFVLTAPVIAKLQVVHSAVLQAS